MRSIFLLSLLSLVLLVACTSDKETHVDVKRPYQPWIVRSVLDGVPRMLTLALHEDLWVSYNTEHCSISKAWKGYVKFDGPVYTTVHGPQPESVGDAWFMDTISKPWQIYQGDSGLPTTASYAGHRIHHGHAELMYTLRVGGIDPVTVYEQVEYARGDKDQTGLERTYTVEHLPKGLLVKLKTDLSSIASSRNIETNGTFSVTHTSTRRFGTLQVQDLEGDLTLRPEGKTRFVTWFVSNPTIKGNNSEVSAEEESQPLGERLIARNDCKTCHNVKLRIIGPAFMEVAKRYPTNDETVTRLVNKVITGGTGIWGVQVMSPHPNLSKTDAATIIRYILSLDSTETSEQGTTAAAEVVTSPAVQVNPDELYPGAITEVYTYKHALDKMPAFSGKPQMAGVMPDFDNISGSRFIGLSENFALHAQGYLHIPEKGAYTFQLWSDDGSTFSLNNTLLIDNDGPHGTAAVEQTIALDAGYYPYDLKFFQGAGDRFLSMDWKRPGATTFEVIPASVYYHTAKQQSVTSGMTLPMSTLTVVPGDRIPLEAVHPSYDLFQARPYNFLPKVGGMDFMSDGTLVICTWDPTGAVYLIRNVNAKDPNEITVKQIATGLAEPLGLKVVDDTIYVLQKQELTKLVDTDGDEIIDEYRTVSNQWKVSDNFHEFAFGLAYREGYFYATLSIDLIPGGASAQPQVPDRGKVMKISKSNGSVEFIATGLRTPNGIGWGVDDELFVTDNQGDWLPSSKLLHVTPGAWFGSRAVDFEGTANLKEKPPVVWLPQDEIGNSPSTPVMLRDGPYAGQMMHGDVTHGGIKRVFVEKVNDEYQGAVFRFIQGLEAGVNRLVYGPDSSIFVGGIGNPGNWGQTGKLWYGLQRLKYNGKPTFEMLAVRAKSDGVEIEFTEPLREGDGWDAADYEVRQWRYVPTKDYGGPKVDETALSVSSAHVSPDHKRVFLALGGMKAGEVIYIHLRNKYVSAPGDGLWSTEAWYTMNQIPQNTPGDRWKQESPYANNTLTPEEEAEGWKLLFDGKTLDGWRNYGKATLGKSWIVDNGTITLDATKKANGEWQVADGGDILTDGEYENFEFDIDWKISNCGNSGIMYDVVESPDNQYAWNSGPEMQILDNSCHPDGRIRTHQAGDLYDMISCSYVTVKPAGEWNKVRVIKNNGHVEHWLNGVKVVDFEMYNDRWKEMIANSKFKDMKGFGMARKGKIVLQDHGDKVWFRNIKIREL